MLILPTPLDSQKIYPHNELMPTPVGSVGVGVSEPNFFENIAPGGKYFKYSRIALAGLAVVTLTLIVFVSLPYIKQIKLPFGKKQAVKLGPSGYPIDFPLPSVVPLPHGKQAWKFSHGDQVTGPKIQTAEVSPLDPSGDETQTVTISVKDSSAVLGAVATVLTDKKQVPYPLKLVSGSPTDGVWQGSWKLNDTYNYVYSIDFRVTGESGVWTGGLTFR